MFRHFKKVLRTELELKRLADHHLNLEILIGDRAVDANHNPFGPGSQTQPEAPLHIGVQRIEIPFRGYDYFSTFISFLHFQPSR
jgi:hypothetical protein